MTRPRISIVIPTYNRASLLRECLHYALTAPLDAEIVVVDNASTDQTPAAVEEYSRRDGRVRYIRNESNIGMTPNLNKAMAEARGDYICVVCDDDLILPGHCERKAEILDRFPEIAIAYCPWHMIDAQGRSSGTPLGSGMLTYPYIGGRDEFGDLLQNNHIMMNSVLFRRSLFEELGGLEVDERFMPSPDWEMWLRYTHGRQTAYLPEPACAVRFHDTSHTVTSGTGQGTFARARVNIWKRWLVERDPPLALNENVWQRMRALWEQDLGYWFNGDDSQVRSYLETFDAIRQENKRAHERRFAVSLRTDARIQTADSDRSPIEDQPAPTLAPRNSITPPRVRLTANFFDYSGYARLSRDMAIALDSAGCSLTVQPEGGSGRFVEHELGRRPDLLAMWQRLQRASDGEHVSIYFGVPTWWDGTDAYARQRRLTANETQVRALRHVGIAMFETDRLPDGWAAACNGMDEVWVPSEFNRRTFAANGVDSERLHVIPFGIDARDYDPDRVQPLPVESTAGFKFLSVFQWSLRKGWDVLLGAYFSSFSRDDDVCLLIRTYPHSSATESVQTELDRFIDERGYDRHQLPDVEILGSFVSEGEMPSLYRSADCFVLPTRGEGWGIPYMEAMASGLPVIATEWSAHLDFMDCETAYLIPAEELTPVDAEQSGRNPFYGRDHRWAEPSVEETARLMRHVFGNREEAWRKGSAARRHIGANWTLERTADWVIDRASRLFSMDNQPSRAELRTAASPNPVLRGSALSSDQQALISWSAPLFDPSGYAEEARHFLMALESAGIPVAAEDIRWSTRPAVLHADVERALENMTARRTAPRGVHVSHILPPHFTRRADALLNVGRTMFETDRLPDGWAEACNRMDRIWVPSEFNRATFAAAGVNPDKIRVVPGAIDPARCDPTLPPLQVEGARGFNFLSIFDWSLRKGWDLLVRAFVEEFDRGEDVALILKTHSSLGYTMENIVAQVSELLAACGLDAERGPDIIFQEGDLPAPLMPRLILAADCFVLPSRGEGWGRPYMEAMALGLPVIGTNWSGNTAFMNDRNSFLIDSEVVDVAEPAFRETPTFKGHRWAEPGLASLRRQMRAVFEDREHARRIGQQARDDILSHYSYCRVAAIIESEIEQILEAASFRHAA